MPSLNDTLAEVLTSEVDQPVSDWSTINLRYPKGRSAQGDRPTWDSSPWWATVLETAKRPSVRKIILQTSVQLGKTTAIECMLAYAGSKKGWTSMLVTPTDVLHKELRSRISTTLKTSQIGIVDERGKGSAGNKLTYYAGNELNFVMGSNESNIVSIPTDFGAADELDEMEDAAKIQRAVELLENRGAARPRFMMMLASTPKLLPGQGGICDYYDTSKRFELHMHCPECSTGFYPKFDLLGWPDSTDPSIIEEQGLAWMTCPHCGTAIGESHHKPMALSAQWTCLDPSKANTSIGFKANIFFNLRRGWSAVAAKYLEVQDDPEKLWNFYNSWMAEPRAQRAEEDEAKAAKTAGSLYLRTQVPADVQYITFGMDVGKDSVWAVALGWGTEGRMYKIESWRLDFAGRDGFGAIRSEINRIFSGDRWQYLGLTRPTVLIGGIDSNYHKPEVLDLCYQDRRIFPLSGNARALSPYKWNEADPEKKHGHKFTGLQVLEISHSYSQDRLESAVRKKDGTPGALHLPSDTRDMYMAHLGNERKSEKLVGGRLQTYWAPISKVVRIDFRDCTRYAMMAGIIKGLHNIKPTKLDDNIDDNTKSQSNDNANLNTDNKINHILKSLKNTRLIKKSVGNSARF